MRSSEIEPAIIEGLKLDFPKRDIPAILARFTLWASQRSVSAPERALRTWVESAERDNTFKISDRREVEPAVPGMFRADGSWDEKGFGDPGFHRFVDSLVTARRRDYTPARIAQRIMARPDWQVAFPNAPTWATCEGWTACPASTSAERCIIDAGHGPRFSEDGERSDPTYAAFRFGIIKAITDHGLKPRDVAELLAQHHAKFAHLPNRGVPGGLGVLLDEEVSALRTKGDRW